MTGGEDDVAELRDLVRSLREHARRIEESAAVGVPRGAAPKAVAVAPRSAPHPDPLPASGEREPDVSSALASHPAAPLAGASLPLPARGQGHPAAAPSRASPDLPAIGESRGEGERASPWPEVAPVPQPAPATGLPLKERLAVLSVLAEDVAACTKCRLHEGRTRSVFARGSASARLVFVGEGPGRDEDLQGAPFVGPAGQLLDKMIQGMGLGEEDVYICNVVKCRPPNNRVPMADEAKSCEPYLTRQLDVVRPEVIVALGKTAVSFLLGLDEPMARLRGRWHAYRSIAVMPTFHPAFLLRSPQYKREVWEDLKLVLARLGLEPPARGKS
ncbi:MAG: uracil-DNA glycosylase [Deltaproteobacteria bacterium]|nr:uracil-DNA glycosylase [Deltaproteobacteria bacterium]